MSESNQKVSAAPAEESANKRLIVSVQGGIVELGPVPKGLTVEVRDFDIDECNAHLLPKDECKECFKEIEWLIPAGKDYETMRGSDTCYFYEVKGKA